MRRHQAFLLCVFLNLSASVSARAAEPGEEIIPLGTNDRAAASRSEASAGPRAELLAQVRLGNRPSLSVAAVRTCGRRGERVKALRFRVLISPARLEAAELSFGNGRRVRMPLAQDLAPNSDSGWLRLPEGGGRNPCLRGIELSGQNGNLTPDNAVVQIFGLVADALPPPAREARRGSKPAPRSRLTLSLAD